MAKNLTKFSDRARKANGFTLIEITVVLIIAGIIIAGVFMMVNIAMKSEKSNRLSQQVITILGNARNYAQHVDNSTLNLAASDFSALGLFPSDVGSTTTTKSGSTSTQYTHVFGGNLNACAAGGTNTLSCSTDKYSGNGIVIVLSSLDVDVCSSLIVKLASSSGDLGMLYFSPNGALNSSSTVANTINLCQQAATKGTTTVPNLEFDFSF